ncbi:winged helix-turn-helix domain-containing protein [Xanthobacter sediminis]
MKIILRRHLQPQPNDPDTVLLAMEPRVVWRGGKSVRLPPVRFSILVCLLTAGPRLMTRDELFSALYIDRDDGGPYDRILVVFMCLLRRQVGPLGIMIETARGQGWRTSIQPSQMEAARC